MEGVPEGRGEVDAGAVIAALEATTGTRLRVNCGKPSPVMLNTIGAALGIDVKHCLIVGDRLYTEIRMGVDAGADTALVLTGETSREMVEGNRQNRLSQEQPVQEPPPPVPTYVLEDIGSILPSGAT